MSDTKNALEKLRETFERRRKQSNGPGTADAIEYDVWRTAIDDVDAAMAEPEPPVADGAALLRELREWLMPNESFGLRSQQVIGKVDELLRRAPAPQAAGAEALDRLQQAGARARQACRELIECVDVFQWEKEQPR